MKNITIESLFELVSLSEPLQVGDLAFYIETSIDKKENVYYYQLFSWNIQTQEKIQWTAKSKSLSNLKYDPKSQNIYFLSQQHQDEKNQLYRMPISGGGMVQITEESQGVIDYHLVPSTNIYYVTSQKPEIKDEDKFPSAIEIVDLSYKLDSQGIKDIQRVFQIVRLNLEDGDRQLVYESNKAFQLAYISHDETYMLYSISSNPDDEWQYGSTLYQYKFKDQSQKAIKLANPEGSLYFHAMNPSETYALLIGNDFQYKFTSFDKIYVYDLKQDSLQCISQDIDEYVGDMIVADFQQGNIAFRHFWINDQEFVFATTSRGAIKVYRGNINGNVEDIFDQKYHITGNSLTLNQEQLLVTYSSLTEPSKLASLDFETGKLKEILDPNEEILANYRITEPQAFTFVNSDDIEIQGWYLPPTNISNNHPAILYIHGGPQVCYGETFFHEMQQLASNGYGVILLNPRGGNGYGQEFVSSILGDYGNLDYQDLMEGLDYVLTQHDEIDPDNLFVMGGSYGGFMTNWIIGRNHRFKAAITQRSISNWISFYGTSDIGPFFVPFQLNEDLSNTDRLWDMSPLKYADQIKTPLLILHGQADLRCPQEQAEQMYIAMKKQRVDTKMILYPQSSHGLSRNGLPNLRVNRLEAILNWLNKYK